jgi:hypothetical protein
MNWHRASARRSWLVAGAASFYGGATWRLLTAFPH